MTPNKKQIKEVKKEIKEYKQSTPAQLKLFEIDDQNKDKYSNTVELYDMLPKYHFGGVKRAINEDIGIEALPILQKDFVNRSQNYKLLISPAAILDSKTGKTIHYYPTQREELVEDAIRRLAASKKKGIYLDNDMGVKFTLYELQRELQRVGHGYNIVDIKEAIEVCNKSFLEIKAKYGDEITISSPIFPFVGMETSPEIEGGKNQVVVMFHPLVTKSIDDDTHRLINYQKLMSYKMALSRYIHKRISHYFTQASITNPYTIKMTTLVRDSGMKKYDRNSDTLKQIQKCLDELKDKKTLTKYKIEKILEGKNLIDVNLELYINDELVEEIRKANNIKNEKLKIDNSKEFALQIEELKKEMQNPIYELSKVFINNIILKVKNNIEYKITINALCAAKEFIKTQNETGKNCNAFAITKTALNEAWVPKNKQATPVVSAVKKEIAFVEPKKVELTDENKKSWKVIKAKFKKSFDKDTYDKWLSKIELHSFSENEITISAPSKFLRDWIRKEYIENNTSKNANIWEICFKLHPSLKKISIIHVEPENNN